jgi:hypothetical protein
MKNLIIPIILGGALLPFASIQAQEVRAATKTYGGFAPGKTFTLTVTEKTTRRTKGTSVKKNVPVPSSIPNFQVGDDVKFTIGDSGQLKGPGFSIEYDGEEGRVVFYENDLSWEKPRGSAATVTKTSSGKPKRATLTFYKFRFDGFIPVTTTVNYLLD